MFLPKWLIAVASLAFLVLAVWTYLLATGRNPLPFPDGGSRIFTTPSPEAKEAIVALLATHGIKGEFEKPTARADGGVAPYSESSRT